MTERGGEIITRIVPTRKSEEVIPEILSNEQAGTTIYTDEAWAFRPLAENGFAHER